MSGGRSRTMSSPTGFGRKLPLTHQPANPSHSATFPVPFNVPCAPSRVHHSPHRFATPSPLPPPSPVSVLKSWLAPFYVIDRCKRQTEQLVRFC